MATNHDDLTRRRTLHVPFTPDPKKLRRIKGTRKAIDVAVAKGNYSPASSNTKT